MEFFDSISLLSAVDWNDPEIAMSFYQRIADAWSGFGEWAQRWRQTLDPAIWLIGAVLALIPGSFAIYKWWFYRNSRLPQRLEELLDEHEMRLRDARSDIVKLVLKPGPENVRVTPPLFVAPKLAQVLRQLNWSKWWKPVPLATAESELEVALVELETKKHFCVRSQALYRDQEATAYLLKGAIASARASKAGANLEERDRQNRIALNHFSRALEIEPNNAEVLEYIAHQHRVLDDLESAVKSYERLAELTNGSHFGQRYSRSRALRHVGEIYEKLYDSSEVGADLNRAKDKLAEALDSLPEDARGQLDHAAIYEVMGRVAEKLEQTVNPTTYYGNALAIYQEIMRREPKNREATAGSARMVKALALFLADGKPAREPQQPPPVMATLNFSR